MAAFPEMPPGLRQTLGDTFWTWWQAWRSFVLAGFTTQGDVEVLTSGNGVIVKSPNGTRWRITVNNAGTITATSL